MRSGRAGCDSPGPHMCFPVVVSKNETAYARASGGRSAGEPVKDQALRHLGRTGDSTAFGEEAAGCEKAARAAPSLTVAPAGPHPALQLRGERHLTAILPQPALQLRAAVGTHAAVGQSASG